MYVINDIASAATVAFYENIGSYSVPDGARILLKFTGIKTNYQRSVLPVPTNADLDAPTYDTNNRYWKLTWGYIIPYTKALALTHDIRANRLGGTVVLPAAETYNIDVYYSTHTTALQYLNTSSTYSTHIAQLQPRLYIDSTNAYYEANQPAVSYTEYANNDLTSVDMGIYGLPTSADDDNRDTEYGVQTWTPDYTA